LKREYNGDIKAFEPSLESNFDIEWKLPGNGEIGPDCGSNFYYAHLDHYTSKVHWCGRFDCPNCYEQSWLARETSHISERIEYGKQYWKLYYRTPIHVVSSPSPSSDVSSHSAYSKLRHYAERLLLRSGMLGGAVIFHQKRMPNEEHSLEDGPHFHVIGYGWIDHTKEIYEKTGWIIKNLGVRKSLRETIAYILSHASLGILPMQQGTLLTTVWFGILSYNKMELELIEGERQILCKFCQKEFPESEFQRIEVYLPTKNFGLLSEIEYVDYIPIRLKDRT